MFQNHSYQATHAVHAPHIIDGNGLQRKSNVFISSEIATNRPVSKMKNNLAVEQWVIGARQWKDRGRTGYTTGICV